MVWYGVCTSWGCQQKREDVWRIGYENPAAAA